MSTHSRMACAFSALSILITAPALADDPGGAGYSASARPAPHRSGARPHWLGYRLPVRRGMKGHDVRALQNLLNRIGLHVSVDGSFGRQTYTKLRTFERRTNRRVNGILDGGDLDALHRIEQQGGFPPPPAPAPLPAGSRAKVNADGLASVGVDAPQAVKDIIAAGNKIASMPYHYGGGHGRWKDSGYDCSGSVSFALHGAGLLKAPLDSTSFESWGKPGYGTWVTIYANAGHAWMMVAGLRFDTSGLSSAGSRWQTAKRSTSGYVVRHPAGL